MPLFKTSAIVLKKYQFGEYDEIFHLLSEDCGKMKAFAKGSRKMSSPFVGRLEPFSEITALFSSGKNFDLFYQVDVTDYHHGIRLNLDSLSCGFYFLELCDHLLPFMSPDRKSYDFMKKILKKVESGEPNSLLIPVSLYFFMKNCGLAPSATFCAGCGCVSGLCYFDPLAGGMLCRKCTPSVFAYGNAEGLVLINEISRFSLETLKSRHFNQKIHLEVRQVFEKYLELHAGVKLFSSSFEKSLCGESSGLC